MLFPSAPIAPCACLLIIYELSEGRDCSPIIELDTLEALRSYLLDKWELKKDLPVESSAIYSIKIYLFFLSFEVKNSVWKKVDVGDNHIM